MVLTIKVAQSELERVAGLEKQLQEISVIVEEIHPTKSFAPHPGKLVEFIKLLGQSGVEYRVANRSDNKES